MSRRNKLDALTSHQLYKKRGWAGWGHRNNRYYILPIISMVGCMHVPPPTLMCPFPKPKRWENALLMAV